MPKMNSLVRYALTLGIAALSVFGSSLIAAAQQENVLYNFGKGKAGFGPLSGVLRDKAGNLYGTTDGGGDYHYGTVYQLIPNGNGGWAEKVLHSFAYGGTDGVNPFGGLIFDASGNLYGTTYEGGSENCPLPNGRRTCGTVYELTPQMDGTWSEQILYNFARGKGNGYNPLGGVIMDASGNLYGTTEYGGTSECYPGGCGTVFELSPVKGGGWSEKVLHSFNAGNQDGALPSAGLVLDAAGDLYGTTFYGGTYGYGTVFELSPIAGGEWKEAILHSFAFNGVDGFYPQSQLIMDALGNMYGTTNSGSGGYGTVFELSPNSGTWAETLLHNFEYNGLDGILPSTGALTFDSAGNLYGATEYGGIYDNGTVFKLTPASGGGWTETVLHSFAGHKDGSYPNGNLGLDAAGNIYGTTFNLNLSYGGTVFEITQ